MLTRPPITEDLLSQINQVIADNPDWGRERISIHLCELWDWRVPGGQVKDISCRDMLRALDKAGIPVPERMSVVGFDGIAQSSATKPPLTTFQVDIHAMTEATCMMLYHILSGGSCEGMQTVVSAKLLLRSSTAARHEGD